MSNEFSGKIIQIIPAPAGMFAVYSDPVDTDQEYRLPIIAIALNDIGNIVPLELDNDGSITVACDIPGFIRVESPGL
jgi:hypothetical protein